MIHPPPASFAAVMAAPRSPRREMPAAPVRALAWGLAAAIVTGAHLGIYAILVRAPAADMPPPLASPAAVMIDLAPIPTVARSEVDNQAKGPASTAQDEATPPEEQAPPPEATITAPPPPPDLKPEAVLAPAPPKPEVKKTEARKPETPAPQAKPHKTVEPVKKPKKPREERVVASRNGGGPRSDQRTADRTAAPTAGDTSSADARAAWQSEVRSRIVRSKRFPFEAHGTTGVALVSVTFTAGGGASNVRLVASSGNAALDAEAVAVMSRAAPYPPPPGGRSIALTIPLNFRR
ncbi:outer membrane transport energization protein TonB [Methylobacterium phyllostachyos]|uniref:Outer membrane transport energization protein TonB n=2 Tax=Methylobacterium phyllostachyos TaxID=582672 RepID=A0A1H0C371_9HYPH|nr:outer membrane transport energization protein TonB [Methylobacterium phyllostachyos]